MRNLNRVFLDKDRPTDVLSFPSGDSPERPFLGDLAVDLAVAQRQARRLGHSVEREIQILLTHGLLHLLGHDHETDRGEMFSLQSRVVRQLFGTGPDGVPDEIGEETR
jgi:probable rRNA maturation factor